ncbi:App1 family protein [Bifidobacterium aquikefiricola]|uniref:DUF2183 domain-containing protein n=1 Tax=Bifidobacterium aquikefiricola TaxID=3059038 RepID=A0AB39U7U6_9BIFI
MVGSMDTPDLPPIRARKTASSFDTVSPRMRIERQPLLIQIGRRVLIHSFNLWTRFSTAVTRQLDWFPRVEPYVGYGTDSYSRLICRTMLAPQRGKSGAAVRGIRTLFTVPAPHTRVKISIDGNPLRTVQIGESELHDRPDSSKELSSKYAWSDTRGYLDLLAQHHLTPGVHSVSYKIRGRAPVCSALYTIPRAAGIGVVSDVDDTIMVTQVPTIWKAAYNMLLLNPRKRMSVPGMSVLYSKISDIFPDAPFFYLSTSPWNVESSIRHFISYHGFPSGPLLLRDLDPRPKSFIPSGVQHKLEFIGQLMADFPEMRFVLIGDDGQKDPTTYATIAKRYPGRIIAIGMRQLSPKESALPSLTGMTTTQPMPETDIPVFYGTTGSNLMKTLIPYLAQSQMSDKQS